MEGRGEENRATITRRPVQIRKVLRFAVQRGFARFDDLDLSSGIVSTAGVLLTTKETRKAATTFATLTDGRDQIQLVFTTGRPGTPQELLATIQRGARVFVTGIPFLAGRDQTKPIPSLFVIELHSYSRPAPVLFDETGLHREVTPRLVIGMLMSLISERLETDNYVRYEPRFITSSQVELETEPLMVRFPGRGTDLFLEVSPLPQLLYAATMTGERRLYAPTRLFSRAYRDGFTSADSPVVAAVEIESGGISKCPLDWRKDRCPWCWELLNLRKASQHLKSSAAMKKRHDSLIRTDVGIRDGLFLHWDESANQIWKVGPGSVFGDVEFGEVNEAELFVSVASTMQLLRDKEMLQEQFSPPLCKVLDGKGFLVGRFYAPCIQASIFRASHRHDLRSMKIEGEQIRAVTELLQTEASVPLRSELILAMAQGKLARSSLIDDPNFFQGEPGVASFLRYLLGLI